MLINILLATFLLLFAVLSWRRINWAIALIIFLLPTYLIRFSVYGIPLTLLECMILVSFAVWIIHLIYKKQLNQISFSSYKWWLLILLVLAGLAVYTAPDKVSALGVFKAYFVEPILFFLLFINNVRDRKDWKWIIRAIGASAILVAVPAIIQKFTGFGIPNEFWRAVETRRVTSWFGYPNAVGLYLAPITVLFIGKLFDDIWQKRKNLLEKLFSAIVIVLSGLAIFFAQSEGAIVGVLAGIIFLTIFYHKKNRKSYLLVIGCWLLVILSLFIIPSSRNYIREKASMSDLSGQIRQQQWIETRRMLQEDRAISGAGLSGYQLAVAPFHQEGIFVDDGQPNFVDRVHADAEFGARVWQPTEIYMYPHNIWLNFWSEIGLFGAIVMTIFVLKLLHNYLRVKKQENKTAYMLLLAMMVTIIIHGLVDVPYFKNDLSVLWWLIFAMSITLIKRKDILAK